MVILRLLIGLIVIFLLVAFSMRNMTPIHLDFYFYRTPDVPLFVVVFLTFILGVAAAWILVIGEQIKMKTLLKKRDRRIKELEKKLSEYELKIPETKEEGVENERATEGIQSSGS